MAKLREHPRFAELRELLLAGTEYLGVWSGTIFRFQSVDYPTPNDLLSGMGAKLHGGRWNPPGIATVYGSTTDDVALKESKASDHYYGLPTRCPRLVVAIDAKLDRVLDLNQAKTRRYLGLSLADLHHEDWRKLLASGKESLTQALARVLFKVKASGLVARSASVASGLNVVVFPENLRPGEHIAVVEGEKLQGLKRRKNRKKD